MISLIKRLPKGVFFLCSHTANRAVLLTCSLIVNASRISAYAQGMFPRYSQQIWMMGQGTFLMGCGVATLVKVARSFHDRQWRYLLPAAAAGGAMIGVGVFTVTTSVSSCITQGALGPFHRRRITQFVMDEEVISLQGSGCLRTDAPTSFNQICQADNYKSVLVACHVADGKGDVTHCKKVFESIEMDFLQHKVDIAFPMEIKPYLPRYFPQAFCQSATYISTYSDILARQDDLVVDCPAFVDASRLSQVKATMFNGTTPHFGIMEFDYQESVGAAYVVMQRYNHTQSTFVSSGLAVGSIGLPFDVDRHKDALKTGFDELARLQNLGKLNSPGLQQTILGANYSADALVNFNRHYSLYPSYTKYGEAKDAFFSTILRYYQLFNETREPCFVFVGQPLTAFTASSKLILERPFFRKMQSYGFNRIDYFTSSFQSIDRFSFQQFNLSLLADRAVRLISLPYTQHQNLLALGSAARIAQATGDMTVAEMIESLTPFLYELLDHKTLFANATANRAWQIHPGLGDIVRDLMTLSDHRMKYDMDNLVDGWFEPTWPDSVIDNMAAALRRLIDSPEWWRKLASTLVNQCNELTKIKEIVQGYLDS